MEITNDIIVNTENLNLNSELEISYYGKLKDSKEVYINYGYTPNSFEYKTEKLIDNKSVKIQLKQPGYFYFYFTDDIGRTDNNSYKDYQLYIKRSNLVLTQNSSMNEIPYRYFSQNNNMYKTFYTPLTLKNTSKPEEIILPRSLNLKNPTSQTKNVSGYILEPIKKVTEYNITQALIPTENINIIADYNRPNLKSLKKINSSFKKLFYYLSNLLGKDFS